VTVLIQFYLRPLFFKKIHENIGICIQDQNCILLVLVKLRHQKVILMLMIFNFNCYDVCSK